MHVESTMRCGGVVKAACHFLGNLSVSYQRYVRVVEWLRRVFIYFDRVVPDSIPGTCQVAKMRLPLLERRENRYLLYIIRVAINEGYNIH